MQAGKCDRASTSNVSTARQDANKQARGRQEDRNAGPVDKLSKAVIPIRARELCTKHHPNSAKDTIVCAGGDGKSTWNFDSGGPLIDQETRQLIGIVSGGSDSKEPGVYTGVGSYIPFIREYLGSVSNPDPNAPPRTEAQEKFVEAQELWYQQVEDHCFKARKDLDECHIKANECKWLRKPDGNMDEVYPCIDKKIEELKTYKL